MEKNIIEMEEARLKKYNEKLEKNRKKKELLDMQKSENLRKK